MVLVNGHAHLNLEDFLFWLIFFQLHLYYIIYAIFGSLGFVLLVSVYINFAQNELAQEMIKLNSEIKQEIEKTRKLKLEKLIPKIVYLREFNRVNFQLAHLCTSFSAYIAFCRPFLSTLFPLYIGLFCYIAFAILFVGVPTLQKYVYSVALVVITALLFAITYQCAKVVKRNGRISKQMAIFAFLYNQLVQQEKFKKIILAGEVNQTGIFINGKLLIKVFIHSLKLPKTKHFIFKIESFASSTRLKVFTFRVAGNYRITNKTFNLVSFQNCKSLFLIEILIY